MMRAILILAAAYLSGVVLRAAYDRSMRKVEWYS